MAKFYGTIGYVDHVKTKPGVYEEVVTERQYYGDWTRISRRLESSGELNDNININNELSVVADPYAIDHFHSMRYVTYSGAKWKISTVEVKYPRLILGVGGLYNA